MVVKFKIAKGKLLECNELPERAKEILNTVNNSFEDLDENISKELWIILHDFIKETSTVENTSPNDKLLACYQCILNLVNINIDKVEDNISIYQHDHVLKIIIIFQTFYLKKFNLKFKLDIVKMCCNFWKLVSNVQMPNGINSLDLDSLMAQNFIFTFNYLFDTIKETKKKSDMKTLSSLLWEFCKLVNIPSSQKTLLSLIVSNLETIIKQSLFLETEPGKLVVAKMFRASQQLFLRFHQLVKKNLSRVNKIIADAYGDIYFISWIDSNSSMKKVIEEQGIFDLISKTLLLKRDNSQIRIYQNALILLHSMQKHRKNFNFSKVITNLYAPVLWRGLTSEFRAVRCNATDVLTRAYPLEKRGEGREVHSRFLFKQQNAFLDLLEDVCPQVRIAAINGICSCMVYFWDTFDEDDQLNKIFNLFIRLTKDSLFEVRRFMVYGFHQLLDEGKSHVFFKSPLLLSELKYLLYDDNEKVRRALIKLLLKIKKIDTESESTDKINFARIVNIYEIATVLSREDKKNSILLVNLIFDNFIGENIPNNNNTFMRFNVFYKTNPTALRKLILHSKKHLNFDSAHKLMLALLKSLYRALKIKEQCLNDSDKDNIIPTKYRKLSNDSDGMSKTHISSNYSIFKENSEFNDNANVCCLLDCVNCLMIIHRHKLNDEANNKILMEIQNNSISCIVKIVKFYQDGDAYYCALNLASYFPLSKLSSRIAVPSGLISKLQKLPCDLHNPEEDIDMRKVDCLVYTLCAWKRGHEILQFVYIWFDEAFRTIGLNESQYPESNIKEDKRVRFQTNIKDCKPLTGISLINSMLRNIDMQKTLIDTDVNKKPICDLILYLERVKLAIEKRISSDDNLNNLLSDEILIEFFELKMRLNIIYYGNEENLNVDKIIKNQTSDLDWAINNLLNQDLYLKNETTIIFATKIVKAINIVVLNICLMAFLNKTFLDHFFKFYFTLLHNYLGSRVLISMIETLVQIAKYLNIMKITDKLENDVSILTDCTCSMISILSETKFNEESFKSIIGDPTLFRNNLNKLVWEIHNISPMEFKQVFSTITNTIISIISNQIREVEEVDLIEQVTEMPFAAYQLALIILNNAQLRNQFSSNTIEIFSSNVYKNENIYLISSISYIYTLSFQINKSKHINLEPIVRLLYTNLMEHEKTTIPLGNNCTIINNKGDEGSSILETSSFSHEKIDFKQKGRNILIIIAKKLHITLSK